MTVAPLEIEDTSDWLGCPTELETCRHFLRMYENEVQQLTLQMRKAREDIFCLVQMHADVSTERDQLRAGLNTQRGKFKVIQPGSQPPTGVRPAGSPV